MRKTMRKILAVVLCLSVLLTFAPMAFATSTTNDDGYNFRGVYRVKQGQSLSVKVPAKALLADDYNVYIWNEYTATVSGIDPLGIITIDAGEWSWGATILTFEILDYHEDEDEYYWVEDINYVVFVYDDEDAQLTGKVTDISVESADVKCDTEGELYYECGISGEVYVDTLVYYEGYGIEVDNLAKYNAYDRGEVYGILYAIDSNGNIVSDTFTIKSTYTAWQWIKFVFRSIFDFLFGWIYR